MHIVDTLKFAAGVAALLIGVVVLVRARGTRGFNQTRQTGVILLVAAAAFIAIGLGFDFRALFR